jgi:CRISPR-associated protein Cas1
MVSRIVEVADDGRHLAMHRGFLTVRDSGTSGQELGRVPIDDIEAVIANAHGLSYTNNLLVALAERGAPFVLCGPNHNAVGMLLPIAGNFEQSHRIDAQVAATKPTLKRLWATIVVSKILQQAAVLAHIGDNSTQLRAMSKRVKSGDPDNLEAQAARHYWPRLMGDSFRRDQKGAGTNAMLNYGYTVVRSATARAVVASGLHPSIGLHHSNDNNAMRLVDDLMEPFRPLIDLRVWQLRQSGVEDVGPESKRALVSVLYTDVATNEGTSPVLVCIQKLAVSLAKVFLGQEQKLELPPADAYMSIGVRCTDRGT